MTTNQNKQPSIPLPSRLCGHLLHLRCFQLGSGIEGFFFMERELNDQSEQSEIAEYHEEIKAACQDYHKAMIMACLSEVDDDRHLEDMNTIRLLVTGKMEVGEELREHRIACLDELIAFLQSESKRLKGGQQL
jgi:hypothetical protein